jgi:hypothetical protein
MEARELTPSHFEQMFSKAEKKFREQLLEERIFLAQTTWQEPTNQADGKKMFQANYEEMGMILLFL